MARLPELTTKEALPPEAHPVFDAIAESRGGITGPYTMLMHSPEVAGRTAQLGTHVRFESTLAPVERELTILTAARECDCAFEWAAHVPLAREAGVREEAIEVVGRRGELDALLDEEAFIVRYGRELLTDHRVGEKTFAAARSRLGERGIVDLTATLGYYAMLASTLNAMAVEPPAAAPRLPALP